MASGNGNKRNAALAAVVMLPSLLFYTLFCAKCEPGSGTAAVAYLCSCCHWHPLFLLNVMFFINVNCIFWLISLIQKSTWLIDPYWTVLPVLMAHFFATHPSSAGDPTRSKTILALVWIWSLRLTHSYFRREDWAWGAREDWRFAQMRTTYGHHWWWISFFVVYVSQQIFLVDVCLPIYAVHQSQQPWDHIDTAITLVCILGIGIAYIADSQLHAFTSDNRARRRAGAATVPVLDTGLWHYSRHPNYLGEQVWWWSLALFSCRLGYPWTVVGAALNTLCLACVTLLVETKMVADENRAAAYRRYQKTTPVWIPIPGPGLRNRD